MHALQPTLRLGRDVWDRDAMPVEEFAARAARLREGMNRRVLDALLLFGSGFDGGGHPTYISNYIVKLPFTALVVLPRDGEPALMFEGATRGRSAAQATTWIEDVRPCWNMAETCLAVLRERCLTHGTIGLAAMPRLVPHGEWTTLASGLPAATFVDAEDLVRECRAIKSAREVRQVQRATEIVRHSLHAAASSTHATEMSLAAQLFRDARLQGAEDIRMMVARFGDDDWAFRPPEPLATENGLRLAVTFAASWERYWSEATRTFIVRGDRLEPVVDMAVEARFAAAVERARASATITDCVDAALSEATPHERHALERCGLGHGIGITRDEAPIFAPDNHAAILPGTCLVLTAAASSNDGLALYADTVVV
jgi:Xaa-Pro aminopeptidase